MTKMKWPVDTNDQINNHLMFCSDYSSNHDKDAHPKILEPSFERSMARIHRLDSLHKLES